MMPSFFSMRESMFADFDRNGADENRPALAVDLLNLLQHRVVFLALGFVNRIVARLCARRAGWSG